VAVDVGSGRAIEVPLDVSASDVGAPVTVGVRPEHVRLAADGEGLFSGRVDIVEKLGNTTHLYVMLQDGRQIVAEDSGESRARVDDQVHLQVAAPASHLFGQDGVALTRGIQ
jgi:ABC-type sugar transport system ATPase subunit